MLILGIETSGTRCSVAFVQDKAVLIEYNTESTNLHTEIVGELVDDGLKRLDLQSASFDLLAVGSGPGSFTGLRIGMAYAKGYAYAIEKPVIPVTNFEILVCQGAANIYPADVLIDARLKRFYYARFIHPGASPDLTQIVEYAKLKDILKDAGQIIVQKHIENDLIQDPSFKDRFVIGAENSAGILCKKAYDKYTNGHQYNLTELEPLYLQKFAGV